MPDEATDVLNEVLCFTLQKSDEELETLLQTVNKDGTRWLDGHILKSIRLNVWSPTSPYQHKYKSIPIEGNIDISKVELEDTHIDVDMDEPIPDRKKELDEILQNMGFSPLAQEVFEFKFFQRKSFSRWEVKESRKQLYETYNRVRILIRGKMEGKLLF
ncbi:hypothetical protein EZS27_016185 [termite gut metagenome]|uniref:Uncharacterized protein n=1 Tax=termite gut metagenome TaxID=433724 RepID=A0A5J4RQ84_9ZZZZ